jgi:hypothetical protein
MPPQTAAATSGAWTTGLAFLLFVPLAGLAAVSLVAATAVLPHGTWDAWAIWNVRARFLFHSWPAGWRLAFVPSAASAHVDYPLLLPLSVMRLWMAIGRETVGAPIAIGAMFAAMTVFLISASVARRLGLARGLVAGAILLACPTFVAESASQIADVPLAFYMMATFVAIDLAEDGPSPSAWAVVALFPSLAGWTKNEGSVFMVALGGALLLRAAATRRRPTMRALGYAVIGAMPALAALAVFRIFHAPRSELITSVLAGHRIARVTNTHRLSLILSAMGREAWRGGAVTVGPLPILLAATGLAGLRRPPLRTPLLALAVVGLMAAAYVVVYATSPFDLAWYLRTSVSRVVMQLLPTTVWAVIMLAGAVGPAERR